MRFKNNRQLLASQLTVMSTVVFVSCSPVTQLSGRGLASLSTVSKSTIGTSLLGTSDYLLTVSESPAGTVMMNFQNNNYLVSNFVDIHYTPPAARFPGLGQQNLRMQTSDYITWKDQLTQKFLPGDVIKYSFTYAVTNGPQKGLAKDSPSYSYTVGSNVVQAVNTNFKESITASTAGLTINFENGNDAVGNFVDVHYASPRISSIGQQNVRMTSTDSIHWSYLIPQAFKAGDLVTYSFTYPLNSLAYNSPTYVYTVTGSSTTPPVSTPPVTVTPPASTAPVSTPPVFIPPVSTPPASTPPVSVAPVSAPAGYRAVFIEDFNQSSLDRSSWNIILDGRGGGNYESQYFTADSVSMVRNASSPSGYKGLALTITPIVNPQGTNVADLQNYQSWDIGAPNPSQQYISQRYYKSGKVTTQALKSFQYGRVDVRAKLPEGDSTWPAIWMLPEAQLGTTPSNTWPNYGEIDIMELFGRDKDLNGGNNTIFGSLNYGDSFDNRHYTNESIKLPSGEFSDAFHVFSVDWEPGVINWYLDGTLYSTKSVALSSLNHCQDGDPTTVSGCKCGGVAPAPYAFCSWMFGTAAYDTSSRFYMILNNSIGGNLGGLNVPPLDQHARGVSWENIDPTATNYTHRAPQVMVIDYVHVYQKL